MRWHVPEGAIVKLKTLFLILVAIPIVGYALIYAYVWLQTKWDLDRLAKQIAPVADFRYGGIRVSPTGTIAVHDLIFAPQGLGDEIRIDRAQVGTPGIEFILNGAASLRDGKLPKRLGLAFTGIRINPYGPLWQMIGNPDAGTEPRPENGLACDISGIATRAGVLESLTPDRIVMDLEERLERGTDTGTASVHVQMGERGFADLGLDLKLANLPERFGRLAAIPTLSSLAARVSFDPEYTRKALALCAKESGLTESELLPRLLAQDDSAYLDDIGMIPGLGIRDLIRGLLTGKTVEAHIDMPAGFDPSSIQHYRPTDVPQLLNLRITLNGLPVTDLDFKTESKNRPVVTPPESVTGAPSPAEPAPSHRPPTPVDIAYADLARCLDCQVLIALRDGRERRGRVDGATNGIVYLKTQLQQGSMTTEIHQSDIAKIRLLGARRND